MATQESIIQLRGTIDNITFARTADGKMIAYKKSSMTREKVMNDSAFERTRENMAEFGRAGKASVVLKTACRLLLQNLKDRTMNRRLVREMVKVIKADLVSVRGQRNVIDGETELLQGFEFNDNASLKKTLLKDYVTTINRVTGVLELSIPSFVPLRDIKVPAGATHCKIISGAYEIDFEDETFVVDEQETPLISLDLTPQAATTLTGNVTANSTKPLFLMAGIQFFQDVNGEKYPLLHGLYNPLRIAMVSGV